MGARLYSDRLHRAHGHCPERICTHTGDLAVMNNEGYITIVDRKKDIIISGGENIYSTEVENILYAHSDILKPRS